MSHRGCGCCQTNCDLFFTDGSVDPLSNGFSTDFIGTWPTSPSGLVIPASSYLQWDTPLPTTGFLLKAVGVATARLDPGIEFVVVNQFDVEILGLRKLSSNIIVINVDGTETYLTLLRDSFGTAGSTILGTYSAFHELMVTQLSAQSRRYEADDPFGFFIYGQDLFWDDGVGVRERLTNPTFPLSARMPAVLPSGCRARIINASGSDVTVAYWRGDKTPDLLESQHLPCDEKREVCRLVGDNHVQQWSFDYAAFNWESQTLGSVDTSISENCYFELKSELSGTDDYQVPGEVSVGFSIDTFLYQYNNAVPQRLFQQGLNKYYLESALSYSAPSAPESYPSRWSIQITPKSHPSDSTKLLLDVTFNLLLPGLVWDGVNVLTGGVPFPPPANVSVSAPGATISSTVTNQRSGWDNYLASQVGGVTAVKTTPNSLVGICIAEDSDFVQAPPGDVVDSFITSPLVSSLTNNREYEVTDPAGVYFVYGLDISIVWTDIEVTKWSGTSPTLNLSAATADSITVNGSTLNQDNTYIYQDGSTSLDSFSAPFTYDSYTPYSGNGVGTVPGEVVAGSGTCPLPTGSNVIDFVVTTVANFKRVDWNTLSITLTGSL